MNLFATTALINTFVPVWVAWLVFFLIAEFTALVLRKKFPDTNHTGGTLSEEVWRLIRGEAWWHHVAYGVFLLFFIDLGFHFFAGTALF
jgi:hypothetical protein